jgi:menaquinone-dependent protoporphyrinogen IX oxidase
MKTLIVYSTKSGAARECAKVLAAKIENSTLCDLDEKTPNIKDYDVVIAGSGIRYGKAYKPFGAFLEGNADVLLLKKTAFFICGKTINKSQENIEKNIPGNLRKAAICLKMFNGKPPVGKVSNESWMSVDEIDAFAQAVNKIA